jgi:acyl phosphate:glycerol-3-phosphate acyltransferase
MIYSVLLFSFLIGSIPIAYLISKIFYGIDIREHGSGNPGATNVWRTLGKKPGILTFILDVLKGFLPVYISKKLFTEASLLVPVTSGFLAVVGHIWTPFLKFKGGKGVATGCGIFLGLTPIATIFSLLVFSLVLMLTKLVALGSISAAISLPILLFILHEPVIIKYTAILLAIIVIWRHKSNIRKILNKTED